MKPPFGRNSAPEDNENGSAFGASNGFTFSPPSSETQRSTLFGTAVGNSNFASGASNWSASASSLFANQSRNPFGNSYGSFGASNGSTSASPFFANQSRIPSSTPVCNSDPFGASNGSTSASPFFANQSRIPSSTPVGNSDPFGASNNGSTFASSLFGTQTPVDHSNGPFGASNGSTSASPFFVNQSRNPSSTPVGNSVPFGASNNGSTFASSFFGTQTPVGHSNGPFGVPFGFTPSSPFFANQSSGPSGTVGATTTGAFGQSSSSLSGFGRATNRSPFKQPPSISGWFGGATTSTTPLFGHYPAFPTPPAMPKPFTAVVGGAGPSVADNSCGGTRASYKPTPAEEERPSRHNDKDVFTSISAMNCYCNKSHEELRLEDYKQRRNDGLYPASHIFGVSNPLPNPFFVSSTSPFQPASKRFIAPPPDLSVFTFNRSPENPIQKTGGGPAIIDNSHEGTRCAPYQPTPAEENNLSWNNTSSVLTSISAMNCCCNKIHEELRSEDYKQIRNGGSSSAAHVSEVSNTLPNPVSSSSANPFQPANSSGWFPPCEPLPVTFNRSSENPIHNRTDSSSSLGSDKIRTTPVQTSPVQTSVAQTRPSPTPTTTITVSNQTSNVNLNDLTSSITASEGVSFTASFVNCIIPAFGALEINGGRPLSSELGTPVLGFPVLIPTTLPFILQYPQVSNPTSALPLLQSETHSNPRMILLNPTSSASTTNPANSHLNTVAVTSQVSPSDGAVEDQITNLSTPASGSASLLNSNFPATQNSSSIPKGLEIIVEHLGFNPWEGKGHLQDSQGGQILLCADASDDADILSLAEFAVEQHNAMEQFRDQPDGKVELLKVTAACLEAVDGGRYHIVLEAKKAASSGIRVYAVVLLKKTNRPTPRIILERWLH